MTSKQEKAIELLNEWKTQFDKLVYKGDGSSNDAGYVQKLWYKEPDGTFTVNYHGRFCDAEVDEQATNLCNLYNYAMRNIDEEGDGNPVHDMKPEKLTEKEWQRLDTDWGEDPDDDEEGWSTVYDSMSDNWKTDWTPHAVIGNSLGKVTDNLLRVESNVTAEGVLKLHKNSNNLKIDDGVNHPSHYNHGKYEAIDVIEDVLTPEEYRGFLKGTLLKYILRAGYKENELKDYRKCDWYLDTLIEKLESLENK